MTIIQGSLEKALRNYALTMVAGGALLMTAPKIIDTGEKTYKDIEDRIETIQAIKAEGIQARSYAEAKMKLDSIRFDRECKELGIATPKTPSVFEKIDINNQYMSHKLKQIKTKLNDVTNN